MASTSSSSSSFAPTSHYEYDVFLSFRGEDTRYSFTDHLYAALCKAGIRTFRDDDEIREGQELKPEIERSIKESRGSVIVFSENFAKSRWCLDELWLILEQKRKVGHFVLPVFYKVDPSHVRNQTGSFSIEGTKWTEDNVRRWKAALTEVANLKGMVLKGYEKDFIAKIVQKAYQQQGLECLTPPTDLTGIEARAEVINSWLRYEQPDFPVLAICGVGGGGKTTLAKHVYYSNKHNFDSCSLLENIKNQPDRLLDVQKQLLKDISGNNNIMISNVDEGAFQLEKAIRMNKVLIVVDDIDEKETLSKLFGTKALHTQSKIIITTRIQNIDGWYGSISGGCRVHKVELLNEIESLELLSFHAFGSKFPMEGFEKLALQLAKYCGGNPLALKVLGSSLSVRAQDQWERNSMIEIWRSRMDSLNSSNGDLDCKIQVVLKRSYESLAYHHHRELFLHIACFFVGESAAYVEKILEDDYHAKSGIMTLINRCLVTVERGSDRLVMHKLLQDMAYNIVRETSKDPATRRRVWQSDESYHLLSKGYGSETIEGLRLNMAEVKQGMTSVTFKTSSIVKMKNLKLLMLEGVKLTGPYEEFPDLKWLRWDECNLKTVPSGLLMSSLVAIDMRYGDLEKFEPPMVLNSLKHLDLSYSYKLVSICNLHRLPKLEELFLQQCTSLTHVCKTVGDLKNLSCLSLSGCTGLWKALSNQKCINQLERLKALSICGGIPAQPLFDLPQSLSRFYMASNRFEILPSYIDLKMIQELYLSFCPNLKSLLCLPSTLKRLYVEWCTSLERITFQSARFTLQEISYEGCFKLFEIEGLFKLQSIGKLEEADLVHRQWIKSYQNHKLDLVGDVITKGRTFNIQMLYEYGIRSTYLQGIEDQSMATHEYTSSSGFLSFRVPSLKKNQRIQGLNVTILYRSSGGENRVIWPPVTKISNRTKGLTWVYVPVVYGKPSFDNDVVWLSYWPVSDILDTSDEVHVNVFLDRRMMMVKECGVSLVYRDDGEVEKDEKCDEMMKGEEVIGGDLSLFQVTKGGYYLCRIDLFKSQTPYYLKQFFGDNIEYTTDSPRWRTSFEASSLNPGLNVYQNPNRAKYEIKLGVSFNSESETDKIEKAVSSLKGVECLHSQRNRKTNCCLMCRCSSSGNMC